MGTIEGRPVERKVFTCKRCEGAVMWGTTPRGRAILLDAEPSAWEPGVFKFTGDGNVVRASRGMPDEVFTCHWGACHE